MKLDLGCGQTKQDGFTGIDYAACPGVDIVHDLNVYPWPEATGSVTPIPNDSVEEIFCSHFFEHVGDVFKFMDECYRVMKEGATMKIICPHGRSDRAFQDPTHVRFVNEAMFLYFKKQWRDINKLNHYKVSCNFECVSMGYTAYPQWDGKCPEAFSFALAHNWNVAQDIHVVLKKLP